MHYLRTPNPMNPEIMAGFPTPAVDQPLQPLHAPGGYMKLSRGPAPVFGSYLCGGDAGARRARRRSTPYWPADLVNRVDEFVYGGTVNKGRRRPAYAQAPLGAASFGGQ